MTPTSKAADHLPALFARQVRADAAPEVPVWARRLFADRDRLAPATPNGIARTLGQADGSGPAPREFRLEVDGIVTRIDLPQVGGAFLESGAIGERMHDAAMAGRLAPPMDRHAPGLRGLPERGAGGGIRRPLPPLPALACLIRAIRSRLPDTTTRFDPSFRMRLYPMLAERPLAGELRALNRRLRPLRRTLAEVPLVPSHNRLAPDRLCVAPGGLRALGWHAADRNDPVWDPAVLSEAAGLRERAARRLLAGVLGRPPSAAERARLTVYRAMAPAIEAAEADLRRGRGGSPGLELHRRAAAWRRAQRQVGRPGFRAAIGILGRGGRAVPA